MQTFHKILQAAEVKHPPPPSGTPPQAKYQTGGMSTASGGYSSHTSNFSGDFLQGGTRFHGWFKGARINGWVGFIYANAHSTTHARRFSMVIDNFGDLVEVAA